MIAQNLRARLALFLVVLLLFPVLVQAAMLYPTARRSKKNASKPNYVPPRA
jgi:hypothetical protein